MLNRRNRRVFNGNRQMRFAPFGAVHYSAPAEVR